ncbi:MAG: hypothetical protein KDD38_09485 [Bdellovibrionales bacterium]|nr:hypothetical protein [Bdellovibrionales bacterium]
MQENEFSEKIALYFYFSCLDESRAQASTIRVLKKIRQESLHSSLNSNWPRPSDVVKITSEFNKRSKKLSKPTTLAFSTGYIVLPEGSNWGPWFEFRKVADDKEFNAVLYSNILKIPDEEIAEGLGISLGAIRYRIGRGLKILGNICLPEESHGQH